MDSNDFPPSLPKTVSSSPNSVSLPTQRSTRLSYQECNEKEKNRPLNDEAMWNGYIEFLHQNYVAKTAKVRLSYSRKYCHILVNGNAQDLMVMTRDKRIHVMKALSALFCATLEKSAEKTIKAAAIEEHRIMVAYMEVY